MPFPVPVVEIAFDASPYDPTPAVWTPVTEWVRDITIDRGRSDDWDTLSGSATVVLSNRDRRFDPFNASSPYNGKLTPRKQIRITATFSGTTYDVFRGFISGWPPQWTDAGWDSTVELQCFDALQLLGSSSLPADWSRDYILSLSPRHYYPCDEPVTPYTTGTLVDYGSNPLNMTTSAYAVSGNELAPGLNSRSVQAVESFAATSTATAAIAATNFTVSIWAIPDQITNGSGGAIGNCGFIFGFDQNTGKYVVQIDDAAAGLSRTFTTTNTYDGGTARLFTFTFNVTSKAFQLYLDGTAVTTTATTAGGIIVVLFETCSLGVGQFQQMCVFTSILTQAQIQNIYRYSIANFPETTSARVTRLIGETLFPAALVSTPASPSSSVLDITNDSPSVSSELQLVADSEFAPLFVTKNGTLTLYSQNQIRTQTRSIVSQATYGTGGVAIGTEIQFQYDGDSMRNVANIQMSGGGVYIDENTSSVSAYGQAEMSLRTQVQTLADAVDIGNIVTGWGGYVYPKSSPIDVVLSPDASWASTLGLELFDRVTLNVTPPTGAAITYPVLVSRISHSISPERWSTTLEGSARWAAVWIWGTSTWGGLDLLG